MFGFSGDRGRRDRGNAVITGVALRLGQSGLGK